MDKSRIKPIRTLAEYARAEAAGAEIEFTAFADDYFLPMRGGGQSGGWVIPYNDSGWIQKELADGVFHVGGQRLRAIYPAAPRQAPLLPPPPVRAQGGRMNAARNDKPATEATYREFVEALVFAASIGNDGVISPETHADYAVQAAEKLIARQEGRA